MPVRRAPTRNRRARRATRGRRARRRTYRARGGFTPYPSEEFGAHMVNSEEAGGAVVIRNVSGVPTPMSVATYKKEYRGEPDDDSI